MACNNCNNNDTDNCGCSHSHSAACSFYKGDNLTCINVNYGDDLQTALENINEIICDISPSGVVTVVDSCDANIEVSSETVGNTTTYTVCLNSDITDQITENTNNIISVQNCLDTAITSLYSDTLSVGLKSDDACGTTWQIELVNPSGTPTYEGIIYNDTTAATLPNGLGGDQIVKSFTWDYISNNNLSDKDEIHFDVRGKTQGDGSQSDGIKISIFDVNSATEVFVVNPAYVDLNTSNTGLASYTIHGEITATDVANGDAIITITLLSNLVDNGVNGSARTSYSEICDDISGVDFSNLRIRVIQTNVTGFTAAEDNACRQLKVEVKKYIGA